MRMIWNMKVIWTQKWHIWFDRQEIEQVLGVGDGQGSPACCSPWGHRVRHNWETELNWTDAAFLPSWNSYKSQESREAWHTNILLHWCVKQNYITLVNNMYVNMYVIRITSSIQEALQILEKWREEKAEILLDICRMHIRYIPNRVVESNIFKAWKILENGILSQAFLMNICVLDISNCSLKSEFNR